MHEELLVENFGTFCNAMAINEGFDVEYIDSLKDRGVQYQKVKQHAPTGDVAEMAGVRANAPIETGIFRYTKENGDRLEFMIFPGANGFLVIHKKIRPGMEKDSIIRRYAKNEHKLKLFFEKIFLVQVK